MNMLRKIWLGLRGWLLSYRGCGCKDACDPIQAPRTSPTQPVR